NTARLSWVLANEEFLTVEIPRYALERFMVQAKRAIEEAPLISRGHHVLLRCRLTMMPASIGGRAPNRAHIGSPELVGGAWVTVGLNKHGKASFGPGTAGVARIFFP